MTGRSPKRHCLVLIDAYPDPARDKARWPIKAERVLEASAPRVSTEPEKESDMSIQLLIDRTGSAARNRSFSGVTANSGRSRSLI